MTSRASVAARVNPDREKDFFRSATKCPFGRGSSWRKGKWHLSGTWELDRTEVLK